MKQTIDQASTVEYGKQAWHKPSYVERIVSDTKAKTYPAPTEMIIPPTPMPPYTMTMHFGS